LEGLNYFGLDDPKKAAFIVGVTQAYRITLWQNERGMEEVMTREIFGNGEGIPENRKVFVTTFGKECPIPLRLSRFPSEQQHELLRNIQKLATEIQHGLVRPAIDDNITITIGIPHDFKTPQKLVGFMALDIGEVPFTL
jgi:hypothetical protein